VLRHTSAQVALVSPDERHAALREDVAELVTMDEPRRRLAGLLSNLDAHYDLGDGHPLLGRRMPDLDIATADGATRVFALLHDARGVLLNFSEPLSGDVRTVDAEYDGDWELPVVGRVEAPAAVLIRPDGHVAWVGDGTDAGLHEALRAWFGAP
jgi:hypothetical protein